MARISLGIGLKMHLSEERNASRSRLTCHLFMAKKHAFIAKIKFSPAASPHARGSKFIEQGIARILSKTALERLKLDLLKGMETAAKTC